MTVEKTLMTAEDLLRLPTDACRYELLDGELIEMSPANGRHNKIMGRITVLLTNYTDLGALGDVLPGDTGFVLRRNPDRVRAPDVCFIAANRLPPEGIPPAFLEIVPDLVVEIVSPSDSAAMVQQKTEEWLQAGVRLVWTVYPETRTVVASQNLEATRIYHETDTLSGEPVLPDFSVLVAALFA